MARLPAEVKERYKNKKALSIEGPVSPKSRVDDAAAVSPTTIHYSEPWQQTEKSDIVTLGSPFLGIQPTTMGELSESEVLSPALPPAQMAKMNMRPEQKGQGQGVLEHSRRSKSVGLEQIKDQSPQVKTWSALESLTALRQHMRRDRPVDAAQQVQKDMDDLKTRVQMIDDGIHLNASPKEETSGVRSDWGQQTINDITKKSEEVIARSASTLTITTTGFGQPTLTWNSPTSPRMTKTLNSTRSKRSMPDMRAQGRNTTCRTEPLSNILARQDGPKMSKVAVTMFAPQASQTEAVILVSASPVRSTSPTKRILTRVSHTTLNAPKAEKLEKVQSQRINAPMLLPCTFPAVGEDIDGPLEIDVKVLYDGLLTGTKTLCRWSCSYGIDLLHAYWRMIRPVFAAKSILWAPETEGMVEALDAIALMMALPLVVAGISLLA